MNILKFKIGTRIYSLTKINGETWSIADQEGESQIDLFDLALILDYLEDDLHEIYSAEGDTVVIVDDVSPQIKTIKLLRSNKITTKKVNTFNNFVNKFWVEDPEVIDTIYIGDDNDNTIYCGEFNPYNYYKMLPLVLKEKGRGYGDIPKVAVLVNGYDYPTAAIGYYLRNKRLPKSWKDLEEEGF